MVSYIIISYNRIEILLKAVAQICEILKTNEGELIIYDNHSEPIHAHQLIEYCQSQDSSKVKLLLNATNKGFGYAVNRAVREAQGEDLLIMNQDVILDTSAFSDFLQFYFVHREHAIVSGKLKNAAGQVLKNEYQLPTLQGHWNEIFGLRKKSETSYAPASLWFISKKNFEKIGGFDEAFFMYGEDSDFAYRASKLKTHFHYYKQIIGIHLTAYNNVEAKFPIIRYLILQTQGKRLFLLKHCNKIERLMLLIFSLTHQTTNILFGKENHKYHVLFRLHLRLVFAITNCHFTISPALPL